MAQDDRPVEQPAVKTTIVGGRPPGSGKAVGPIPRGIEVLIKKAAVDPAFKRLLLAKRDEAAGQIGLTLDPAEALMLKAAPAAQLEAIITQTNVHPSVLPAFLGRAAAVMLVALGAGTLGCEDDVATLGVEPDRPPAKKVEPPPNVPAPEGVRPDRPQAVERSPGIRPDRIPTPQPPKPAESQIKAPQRIEPTDGIRPSRPPEAKPKAKTPKPPAPQPQPPAPTGIRPDRPPTAKPPDAAENKQSQAPRSTATEPATSTPVSDERITRGIRPDRPQPKAAVAGIMAPEKPQVQTLTIPAAWNEKVAMEAFAKGLQRLAVQLLPKHTFTSKDGQIRIAWKTQEYRLTVPSNKAGDTEVMDATGPAADGLILTTWIEKEEGQAKRPQTIDRGGKWKTRLGQVQLLPLKTYLRFNLDYGPKTQKGPIAVFTTPDTWLRASQRPDPSPAVSRGVRPDRPQTKGIRPDRPKAKSDEAPPPQPSPRPDQPPTAGKGGSRPDRPPSE